MLDILDVITTTNVRQRVRTLFLSSYKLKHWMKIVMVFKKEVASSFWCNLYCVLAYCRSRKPGYSNTQKLVILEQLAKYSF